MATRYCINCGQPFEGDVKFCPGCGVPVPPLQNEPQPGPQPEPQQSYAQPQYESRQQPTGPKPTSYLVLAILATIFCCLPFGIPAIVFAAKVDSHWNAGNYQAAEESSRKARTWMLISVIVGLVWIIAYFALFFAGVNFAGRTILDNLY
ncbi:MAG: CD225/dispanin family protein [Bacteroidales bacterium]|nr:CD225/dispanin family protein [Bacteroidales bacterium]